MKKISTALFVVSLFTVIMNGAAWGQLFIENFDYPVGDSLNVLHGWVVQPTASYVNTVKVDTPGLTYSGYASSGVGNSAKVDTTGQDVYHSFAGQTSGSVYAALLVNISKATTTGDYFFHFTEAGTFTFLGRLHARLSGADVVFGLLKGSTGTVSYTTSTYAMNTTHLLVMKYKFNTSTTTDDSVYLWVNPTIGGPEPPPDLSYGSTNPDFTTLSAVNLRQGSAANAPRLLVDGIRVTTAWPLKYFALSSSDLDFGDVVVGSPKTDSVTVTNIGSTTINISAVASDNPDFDVTPTSGTITAGNSEVFHVTFTPSSAGSQSGNVVFTHDGSSSPDTVAVTGNGVQPGFLLSPTSIDFGNVVVGFSKTDSVKVTNTGIDSLDVTSVDSDNPAFTVSGGTKIGPGDSVSYYITFTPTSEGAQSGNIVFTHDALSSPDTVEVSGTGVAPPPPAVSGVARNTRVPEAGDTTEVTCTIADLFGVSSANLIYNVDGVPDTVAMAMTGGTPQNGTYRGVIPGSANADGNRIEYQIEATSDSGLSTTTPIVAANSYFAGTSTLSLDGLRAMGLNRQILYDDYAARVTGTVNAPNDQTTFMSYYIQDAVGGINMFSFNNGAEIIPTLNLGDSVTALGRLDQFRGKTEILLDTTGGGLLETDIVVLASGRPLTVTDISLTDYLADPEPNESRLIRMSPLSKKAGTWPALGSSTNLTMYQNDTNQTIIMRIDGDYNIDGNPEPTYPIQVVGLGGQFTSSTSVYNDGYQIQPRFFSDISPATGVEDIDVVPKQFALKQNYPNPFNPSTEIQYALPKASLVTLKVFNILGQEVATLVNAEQAAGNNTVVWNGRNTLGNAVGSGMYFYRIEAKPKDGNTFVDVKKMLLLK